MTGLDLSQMAVSAAEELAGRLRTDNVRFACPQALKQKKYDTVFSCRTVHENARWRPLIEEMKAALLSMEEPSKRYEGYVRELSALVKPQGYLVSIERCEEDDACAGLVRALAGVGLCQVKGTCMQFSCKNGDEMAAFQAMVFQKADG